MNNRLVICMKRKVSWAIIMGVATALLLISRLSHISAWYLWALVYSVVVIVGGICLRRYLRANNSAINPGSFHDAGPDQHML